jgi:hypothetical protein
LVLDGFGAADLQLATRDLIVRLARLIGDRADRSSLRLVLLDFPERLSGSDFENCNLSRLAVGPLMVRDYLDEVVVRFGIQVDQESLDTLTSLALDGLADDDERRLGELAARLTEITARLVEDQGGRRRS